MRIAQSGMSIRKPPRNPNSALSRMSEDLHETIKDLLIEELMLKIPKEDIGNSSPLFGTDGLGLDSIDALELIVLLQQKYNVKIENPQEGPKIFQSVNTMAAYIAAHKQTK